MSDVEWRLRIYRVREGAMAQWLEEWRAHVLPLRRRLGFVVPAAWVSEQEHTFIWLVGWEGDGGWEEASRAYYESDERRAMDPDPARHLVETREVPVRPLDI